MSMNLIKHAFKDHEIIAIQDDNGDPWFDPIPVCEILGIGNHRQAISKLEKEEKTTVTTNDGSHKHGPDRVFISESGLYMLIFKSRKKDAVQFRLWITREVLPSIRRTGSYQAPADPQKQALLLAKSLLLADEKIQELEKDVEQVTQEKTEMEPAARFGDLIMSSIGSIPITDFGKQLASKGFDTGPNRISNQLKGYRVLKRSGSTWSPTYLFQTKGYFELVDQPYVSPNVNNRTSLQLCITAIGRQFVLDRFFGQAEL